MKKKKIIFFHPYSVIGGADLSISKLIDSISREYDIDFLTISKKPKIRLYVRNNLNIVKLKSNKTILSFFEIRNKIKKDLKNYEKVILISNQNFANVFSIISCFKLKELKIILFERNHLSELDQSETLKFLLKNIFLKLLIKIFYRFSNLVITNSFEASKDLEKFTGTKVQTIQNFYIFSDLIKKSKERPQKKIKFQKNIVLNVGRFEYQKNQIVLLRVFNLLKKMKSNINLVLIGSGSKINLFKNYIKKNNLNQNIQIISGVKNSLPYFKKCNLYVSTSKYEGFPNALVEATFFKLPIISLNFKSGLNEILCRGKGGLILKNDDLKNIAEKIILHFKNEKYLKKKQNFAKKNLKNFSYQIGIKKFKKIILNI